ncbi:putative dual specificity protein phosphatase DSP8 [Vitis vinifera]|uniref:Putative dual specificity protein phosphatase DSP8 n=1 Tax=Vitis vinifera TaxID=29760 RepID=A0A438ES62_VITVI|nr:putative dual specificity protein phosphatase DSP8 [Vitis vinifera]
MYIEELKGGEVDCGREEEQLSGSGAFRVGFVAEDARRALVGAGARALFYPTLLYNVLRNKVQAEFRWWDRVDEFVLLGAVPFPSDVSRLKELGVGGVVTLNEPYETLVPTSLYHAQCGLAQRRDTGKEPKWPNMGGQGQDDWLMVFWVFALEALLKRYKAHDIDHLVIPTRDYLFAPSLTDIRQAVDFIHSTLYTLMEACDNFDFYSTSQLASKKHGTKDQGAILWWVCISKLPKSSEAIGVPKLVQHKHMMPADAYDYLKSIRPRVLLASSQWQAVQEYYYLNVKKTGVCGYMTNLVMKPPVLSAAEDLVAFDDDTIVVVTESDLDGYDPCLESGAVGSEIWADLSVVYRFRVAGQAALARISCLWLRYHANQRISGERLVRPDHLGGLTVDIQVY